MQWPAARIPAGRFPSRKRLAAGSARIGAGPAARARRGSAARARCYSPRLPMDYKATLNLPATDFAMKADLQKKEPEILARWEADQLYDQIQKARRDAPIWVLHDGPP